MKEVWKIVLLVIGVVFFLGALGYFPRFMSAEISDFIGVSERAIENGALAGFVLAFAVIGTALLIFFLETISFIFRRKFFILVVLNNIFEKLNGISDSILRRSIKFILALVLAGVIQGVLTYIDGGCYREYHDWGYSEVCGSFDVLVYLVASMLCFVYALFPDRWLMRQKTL